MKINDHVTKARRIQETMLDKLDRNRDYEMTLECYMLAGTHWLNAVLHKLAITTESADLLHSDKPPLPAPVDGRLIPMFESMKYIEQLRPGYLRGSRPWAPADGEKCEQAYQLVKRMAQQFL